MSESETEVKVVQKPRYDSKKSYVVAPGRMVACQAKGPLFGGKDIKAKYFPDLEYFKSLVESGAVVESAKK